MAEVGGWKCVLGLEKLEDVRELCRLLAGVVKSFIHVWSKMGKVRAKSEECQHKEGAGVEADEKTNDPASDRETAR